ncbi:MAG TPA: cytochrome P450 [Streptosporangiaceae bacterium]|nr:cytochrome P450 [Streptosporangiaceae bacterium]
MSNAEAERLGEAYFQDTQGVLGRMRSSAPATPVVISGVGRAWLITPYEENREALADPRLSKDWVSHLLPEGFAADDDPVRRYLNRHLLNLDPPDHTRLRRLVGKAFTPRRIAALRPRIVDITTELADRLSEGPEVVDLIDHFAVPLPVTVICELLGVSIQDRDQFRGWSASILSSESSADEFHAAATEMYSFFAGHVNAKRHNLTDDIASAMIEAHDSGDSLDEHELIAMMFLLILAGHESSVNMIGNGTLALLSNPAQLALLQSDPGLINSAVEELLRYSGPLNLATERFTLEPVQIGSVEIPAGEWVFCALSAANRDQSRFPDADQLDILREDGGHLAFGHGIHYCLGAPLARMEAEIAFSSLFARFPRMSLAVPATDLRWRSTNVVHGLQSLPVRLRG